MAIRGSALPFGVHHEHSHSSSDFVYGCCRLYVGEKHAINHRHYHAWFDYWSSHRCRARDHVHSQSHAQTHLVRNLSTQPTNCDGQGESFDCSNYAIATKPTSA